MRKLIILVLIIFGSLGIVSAQEYPDKLNGGEKLNKITDFRGIYEKIYDDVNNEDLVEVCERTLLWPEFWKKNKNNEDELIYSIKNCQNLRNKSTLTNFLNKAEQNINNFNTFKNNFTNRFELEQSLLRTENDLRRETGFSYIFSDGAEDTRDSPFDLISDLNEIDEIFFGEKTERPDLNFTQKIEKEMTVDINSETKELWLNQIEENHQPLNPDFENYKDNFSGNLWKIAIKVLREDLNTYALWTQYVGKTMFDRVDTDGVFPPSGFTAATTAIPPLSSDMPESEELTVNPLLKLNTLNKQALFSLNRSESNSVQANIGIDESLKIFNFSGQNIETEIQNAIISFKQNIIILSEKNNEQSIRDIIKEKLVNEKVDVFKFIKTNKTNEIDRVLNDFKEELMSFIKDDKKDNFIIIFESFSKELKRLALNNKKENINQFLNSFDKESYRENEKSNFIISDIVLNQLKLNFNLFREGVNYVKDLFPSFLDKPTHSS
jgi:succinate dehydrogenase flavin-adding protein (antitoxin of CptAB toxin-antitoxin module)